MSNAIELAMHCGGNGISEHSSSDDNISGTIIAVDQSLVEEKCGAVRKCPLPKFACESQFTEPMHARTSGTSDSYANITFTHAAIIFALAREMPLQCVVIP